LFAVAIAFGDNEWALLAATAVITFLILVFSEITPKIIGATFPERIALPASYVLLGLLKLFRPAVWFVNLFVQAMLWLMRIPRVPSGGSTRLTSEELRTLVLEGGQLHPMASRSILLNLFDLEQLSVDDVMTPRARIESIDIDQPAEAVLEQLRTCYHNKLPVHEGDINRAIGMLHVRKLMHLLGGAEFTIDAVRSSLVPIYFMPSGTSLYQQLQLFQDNRQRLGYGGGRVWRCTGSGHPRGHHRGNCWRIHYAGARQRIAPLALGQGRSGAGRRFRDAA
jgi:Mg2+/Co2+ transporter CorB